MACAVCGSKKNLVVHHISYKPERTIIVCASCHYKIHFTPWKIPRDKWYILGIPERSYRFRKKDKSFNWVKK